MRVAILNHLNKTAEARSELNQLIAELVNFPELSENEVHYVHVNLCMHNLLCHGYPNLWGSVE